MIRWKEFLDVQPVWSSFWHFIQENKSCFPPITSSCYYQSFHADLVTSSQKSHQCIGRRQREKTVSVDAKLLETQCSRFAISLYVLPWAAWIWWPGTSAPWEYKALVDTSALYTLIPPGYKGAESLCISGVMGGSQELSVLEAEESLNGKERQKHSIWAGMQVTCSLFCWRTLASYESAMGVSGWLQWEEHGPLRLWPQHVFETKSHGRNTEWCAANALPLPAIHHGTAHCHHSDMGPKPLKH